MTRARNGRNGGRANGNGRRPDRPALITGGAGFIGTNLAHRLLSDGHRVILLDNLSRAGVERNWAWLHRTHGDRVELVLGDVRDAAVVRHVIARAGRVFHLAAQVAVTTSLTGPIHDFEVNARGTLNVLEALRAEAEPPPVVFTSTNKVYGGCGDVALVQTDTRYEPADEQIRRIGIGEDRPLDFHSPYGCSKGAADQYILDYARSFDLPTAVFRMSCIYGPHQFGNEDQGWVAHFLIQTLARRTLTLYGNGKQVRDVLFVEDLVDAFLLAEANIARIAGQAFNIGGGPCQTASLLELMDMIAELHGERSPVRFGGWRPGDQRYYVSDTQKFRDATGWAPRIGVRDGVARLYRWLAEQDVAPERMLQASDGRRAAAAGASAHEPH